MLYLIFSFLNCVYLLIVSLTDIILLAKINIQYYNKSNLYVSDSCNWENILDKVVEPFLQKIENTQFLARNFNI